MGHAGTLDPFATGLLTGLVGPATRLARYLTGLPKEYVGVLRLGERTDTDDLTGVVLEESVAAADAVEDATLARGMAGLVGTLAQLPPRYSAKKVSGVPAHRRVRRGEDVDLAPVEVTVHRFGVTDRHGRDVSFSASVGSGTYIRALARDLGDALGCGAHLRSLRRTRVGPFDVKDAVPADRLTLADLLPLERAVEHLPRVDVDGATRTAVSHGRAFDRPDAAPPQGTVAIFHDQFLCAVGEAQAGVIQPRVVFTP